MADRAKYIKLGVSNGITDLSVIRDTYNKFAEGGQVQRYGLTYDSSIKGWRNSEGRIIGGGFRASLPNGGDVHFNTDGTITDMNSPALVDIRRRLRETENSKSNPHGGWNEERGIWKPHSSPEGGDSTIAYGLKLQEDSSNPIKRRWVNEVKRKGYLTDEEAEKMLGDLSLSYMNEAKKAYNRRIGKDTAWDELSPKSQSILTDYQYNVGLNVFKNLVRGFDSGDIQKIKDNYKRRATINGRSQELTGRNNSIRKDIDSLESNFYPIKIR